MAGNVTEAAVAPKMQLHQTWFTVLKPKMLVLANGQPAYDMVGAYETLHGATMAVRNIAGGVIALNCVIFINPDVLPSNIRDQ